MALRKKRLVTLRAPFGAFANRTAALANLSRTIPADIAGLQKK